MVFGHKVIGGTPDEIICREYNMLGFLIAAFVVIVVGLIAYINTFSVEYVYTNEDDKATVAYIKRRIKHV